MCLSGRILRLSVVHLTLKVWAACFALFVSLAANAGMAGPLPEAHDAERRDVACAPIPATDGACQIAFGAVDSATGQPFILLSGMPDAEEDAHAPPRRWVAGTGCDARVQRSPLTLFLTPCRKAFQARAPPADA
jgi:hypothetical protein